MAPRTRKIPCKSGLVHFSVGVTTEQVNEFLKVNKIERVKDSPEWMTTEETTSIQVPPAETYIIPDDIYVWVRTDLAN